MKVSIPLFVMHVCKPFKASSFQQNKIFQDECNRRELKFGTSAFHSYVHEWACQLIYNPRLNKGWGKSDGEGLERVWAFLSSLVSPNRYATKQHRLDTVNLRSQHKNDLSRINAGNLEPYQFRSLDCDELIDKSFFECVSSARSTSRKLREVERLVEEAGQTLCKLQAEGDYSVDYFSNQWERQKQCQLAAMANDSQRSLEEELVNLLDLEEQLEDAQ